MATNPKKEKLAALKVEQLKPKAKRLGVKLTNPSGNAKTKAQLITAIIKAEDKKPVAKKPAAKKPAAKRSAVKKGLAPVVGASKRRDAKRQALPPGRRVSKTGRVYYERRSNRADKGQMLGEKYQGWANYWTWRWSLEMIDEDYIYDLKNEVADSYEMSKVLKEQAEDFVAESIGGTPFESWMFAVLGEIDWREIAEAYYEK
jgi:hypothetical protein